MQANSPRPSLISSRAVGIHAPEQGKVIARLTLMRASGFRTIVEVRADASFHCFYRFYKQFGARRSTKQLIRTASRSEGLLGNPSLKPGLDLIAERNRSFAMQTNPVLRTKLRIIRKRAYRKLLSVSPSELGMTISKPSHLPRERFAPLRGAA